MTSEASRADAYVWVWLPGAGEPVVAGALQQTPSTLGDEAVLLFRYGRSYRERSDAVALSPDLPLTDEVFDPTRPARGRDALALAGALRDAAPDAWGRRVIDRELGATGPASELRYLLGHGTDRIGALDFQAFPTEHVTRDEDATLQQLMTLAELVEAGEPIPAALSAAAQHGTSIGGARPKALLRDQDRHLIAKFPSSADDRPVVQSEAVAMMLAVDAGLDVAPVQVVRADGKDVLLVERFDRVTTEEGTVARRQMLSMLTILGLHEMNARYASYPDIAEQIRTGPWVDVEATLREVFARMVLNVLVGNNDDHLRNHAAFWDGTRLTLTPAYDVAPQRRSTHVSTQALAITRDGRRASQLRLCLDAAGEFLLSRRAAAQVVDRIRAAVDGGWDDACDRARLSRAERTELMGREFCNPYVDYAEE